MSVYFARVGRYIKIGYSRSPERRVANLFKSGTRYARPVDCPLDAERELLAVIPGGLNEEAMCHGMLEGFAAGCEFFIDEPPVRTFIAEALEGRFMHPVREGGPFEPVSAITDEDRAKLQYALDHMFDRVPGMGDVA
jgi:hypothetical protein